MQKYNAYVEAANTARTPLADIVATYQRSIKPVFESGKDLTKLFFPSDPGIDRIKAQLDKALAMKPAMPELDGRREPIAKRLPRSRRSIVIWRTIMRPRPM